MNIGIVGIGYWGSTIARVFDELKREKITTAIINVKKLLPRKIPNAERIVPQTVRIRIFR